VEPAQIINWCRCFYNPYTPSGLFPRAAGAFLIREAAFLAP
jgi:hypothetical protein